MSNCAMVEYGQWYVAEFKHEHLHSVGRPVEVRVVAGSGGKCCVQMRPVCEGGDEADLHIERVTD